MKTKRSTINIDTDWTELEEDFDISSFGLYCTEPIEFQEYGISGWSSSVSVPASTSYFKETSVQKIRVKTVSGSSSLNYSLSGLINYSDSVSGDFNLSDLGDVDDTDKAENKILKVDSEGNHIYVTNESGTDEKVKYDASDPSAGYLSDKIIAGDGISVSEGTGANENKVEIENTDKGSDVDLFNLLEYKDIIDASTNPNYPEAESGDVYRVSVAGKVGGNSGKDVALDNFILCISDSASGDEAAVGSNWFVIGGDMRKSVYDSDGDGIVDKAENIDDGVGNSKSASQVATHIDSTSNPHSVDKTDVSLGNVPNLDTTNAVNKAHDRSHAIDSTDDHTSTITENNLIDADVNGLPDDSGLSVSDVSDAVTKKHTQNTDTKLDEGGANEVSASEAKSAYTHSIGDGSDHTDVASNTSHRGTTTGNPHSVSASDVGLGSVEDGADITDSDNVDSAGAVMETDYNANTILKADINDTPLALTIPEQTIVGRKTGGNIDALTASEVRTILNVEDGSVSLSTVKADSDISDAISHAGITTGNPHSIDNSDVGLGNVTNNAQVIAIASSTDNAIVRFDGTSGQVQDSSVVIDDSNNVSGIANLTATGTATFNDDSNATVVDIDNDGTGHGLYLHQDGVLASGKYGLYVYSNAAQTNSDLVAIHMDNASSTRDMVNLDNDGTGHGIYLNQAGVLASAKYALYVYSNGIQTNSPLVYYRNDNASSTTEVLKVQNDGSGESMVLVNNGDGAHINFLGDPSNSSSSDGDFWFDGTDFKCNIAGTVYTFDTTAV